MPVDLKEDKKVSEMTVRELKDLIKETIYETVDPDYGLELRPEIEKDIHKSVDSDERIPVESVAKTLGLQW